jgi:eukaryotic-like serine/threonine-protein kinase
MTLTSGSRLGPYEIVEAVGAGGMGEVYRARDTRLERTVAIKVLPDHLSQNEEIRQRFEREAKTISQITHPHICALYDVNREGETEYLVMEFLDGETLADRLSKGPLPSEQLIRFGIEIADALDKAHRLGIVHRDLKPGNVMLTKSGVKLLDFGLAKFQPAARDAMSGVSRLATAAQQSQPLTERGTVLGTFQYMAPEQLEGKDADARSDIFAFGAVLYEMATGHKAFEGKSQASLIGAILRDQPPPISGISPMTPPALDRVVKTCMAKDPEDRFQTAHDVNLQLQWISEGGSQVGLPAPVAARRRNREKLAWAAAAVAAIAALALGWGFWKRAPGPQPVMRFEIPPPLDVTTIDVPRISPDGKLLAFDATDAGGKNRIWVRPLDSIEARALPGTDGGARPFWSPDSQFVAFVADGVLKKVGVSGGPPSKICDAPGGSDGTWSPQGVILFDGTGADPIHRVPAAGGTKAAEVGLDKGRHETSVGWPEFLPDGRHYLYLVTTEKAEDNAYWIGSIDSKERKKLAPAQTLVTYSPPGYLLFARDRTLVAQPFDAKALETRGEPIPLAEKIGTDNVGLARFSVSRNGVLVYRTAQSAGRLLWRDRTGRELESPGDPGVYNNPAISPTGDRVAYNLGDPRTGKQDIWVRDLARGITSRFSLGTGDNFRPIWSPDGAAIVFGSDRGGSPDLYEKSTRGQAAENLIFHTDDNKYATSWSRDGRYIAFTRLSPKTNLDVWALPMFGDRKPIAISNGPFAESLAMFSSDGRHVAYVSNESGREEIYVQTFPEAGGRWQVSTGGGTDPSWRGDGKELFYRALDQKLMAVDIQTAGEFQAGIPKALFAASVVQGVTRNRYSPSPDGQRFVFVAPLGRDALGPTSVVLNWPATLGK